MPGAIYIPAEWSADCGSRPELRQVILLACGELGAREAPPHSNRGPRVDLYTGGRALRWCIAFVRWCYTEAGLFFPRTFSVSDVADWGAANGHLVRSGP